MPKTISLFSYFPNLTNVSAEEVVKRSAGSKTLSKQNPTVLENEIGNRILYPEAVPVTSGELELDLAILREAIKLHPDGYLNNNLKKLIIPEEFLTRFPDLLNLAWAFVEGLAPHGVISLYLKSTVGNRNLGTYIRPQLAPVGASMAVWVDNRRFVVNAGSTVVIPTPGNKFVFKFESTGAELLGQSQITFEAVGGRLGLLFDAR